MSINKYNFNYFFEREINYEQKYHEIKLNIEEMEDTNENCFNENEKNVTN